MYVQYHRTPHTIGILPHNSLLLDSIYMTWSPHPPQEAEGPEDLKDATRTIQIIMTQQTPKITSHGPDHSLIVFVYLRSHEKISRIS